MSQTQVQSGFIRDNAVTTAKLDSTVSGALVPIGGIIMWSGSIATIPSSWRLCNGENGTPNLQDRFIVGAGSGYAVAATGGSENATLVSHRHTITDKKHDHTYTTPVAGAAREDSSIDNYIYAGGGTTGKSFTGITETNLEGPTPTTNTANLPPYYALAFIMRIS